MTRQNLPAEAYDTELVTEGDLLLTSSPLSIEQLKLFYQKTPANKIYKRKAKGGGEWDYIKTGHVIDTLNRVFAYMWDFETFPKSPKEILDVAMLTGQAVVTGRLTVHLSDGRALTKEQTGRCDVKYLTKWVDGEKVPTDKFLDFGNDVKGATSDALKKCASELGLFRDIYHKADFEELDVISDDEKQQMEDAEVELAKAALRDADSLDRLREIFKSLPLKMKANKAVVASKNALKRKLAKGSK